MKKEKFTIIAKDEENKKISLEIEGLTYKGLGIHQCEELYNITHLTSGEAIAYFDTELQAITFVKALAELVNCELSGKEFMDIICMDNNYKIARNTAIEVTL